MMIIMEEAETGEDGRQVVTAGQRQVICTVIMKGIWSDMHSSNLIDQLWPLSPGSHIIKQPNTYLIDDLM